MLTTLVMGCDDPEDTGVDDRAGAFDVILDGVRFQPEDMEQFEDQDLHYYIDAQAQSEEIIYAFSDIEDRNAFMVEREPAIEAYEADQLTFRAPLTYSKFYDFFDFDTKFGQLKKGQSISNLGSHPDYNNDDISSVKCRLNAWTFLWANTNFNGSSLTCRAINIDNLSDHSFNQIASSLEVTP
ncbi:MAG: hypothetical protein K0V04_37905 [Deltaproteobacteria bacterium]|nr:hypothetical protein [Deltaproteobacteria bacterium]